MPFRYAERQRETKESKTPDVGVGFFYGLSPLSTGRRVAMCNAQIKALKENNFQIHFPLGLKIA